MKTITNTTGYLSISKSIESEILKHLVFACVASADGKRRQPGRKVRKFDRDVIDAYKKPILSATKYNRKTQEMNIAMKLIDRLSNPEIASYNVKRGHDFNNVGCYELTFSVMYNDEYITFKFHSPITTKNLQIGKNNYPYIISFQNDNNEALNTTLGFKGVLTSGISELELYC